MMNRRAFLALPFVAAIARLLPKRKTSHFADGGEIPAGASYLVGEHLSCQPPWLYGREFRTDLMLWGNHFRYVERDSNDLIIAMHRLEPEKVQVIRCDGGKIIYRYREDNRVFIHLGRDVIHVFRDGTGDLKVRGLA